MKATVKNQPKVGFSLIDVTMLIIDDYDVLIKIKATSICGTDMHLYNWDQYAQSVVSMPLIIGHEFSGEVVNIGKHVKGIDIGNKVLGEGYLPCYRCTSCRNGQWNLCSKNIGLGINRQGAFA